MFRSSGTGWRMISWKNFSPSSIRLSHSPCTRGLRSFHQNSVRLATGEFNACFAVLVLVDQPDMSAEEPPHLVAEPRSLAPVPTTIAVDTQLSHEPGNRRTQNQFAGLGLHRFGANPGQQQAGEIPEGQSGLTHGRHDQGVGAVDALVLKPVTGVGAGQGTQHHQPRHEPRVSGCFTGSDLKLLLRT